MVTISWPKDSRETTAFPNKKNQHSLNYCSKAESSYLYNLLSGLLNLGPKFLILKTRLLVRQLFDTSEDLIKLMMPRDAEQDAR